VLKGTFESQVSEAWRGIQLFVAHNILQRVEIKVYYGVFGQYVQVKSAG